jgi:integrase
LLLAARMARTALDRDTAAWLADVSGTLRKRLAAVGLIDAPTEIDNTAAQASMVTLDRWLTTCLAKRADVSPNTRRIWGQTKARLTRFFGPDRPLARITRGDAIDWRLSLVAEKLADASVRKHCGFAKHFFAQAVDHEIIMANPFGKLVSAPVGNEARQYFVSRQETQRVLDACPDAEWRLIVALSRFGGLRCPSEHFALTWEDVNWAENRLHVASPKTERHEGHKSRTVPVFPELRPYLEAAWEAAEHGTLHVISRHRMGAGNLRTQLARIVKRAGLTPWPRITHNLRSSRQTELEESFPSHVVCRWIGDSPQMARKHYLQVTEEHFQKAIQNPKQNPKQQAHETARNAEQTIGPAADKSRVLPVVAAACSLAHKSKTEVHGNRTHLPRVCRPTQRF